MLKFYTVIFLLFPTIVENYMTGFSINIEEKTLKNSYFREVLYTGPNSQLVVMTLQPEEEIGMEIHMIMINLLELNRGLEKLY